RPAKMYAIPLVARGRGVAALYVDGGKSEQPVNIEALEMLVRVASLTVELLASNQAARPHASEGEQAEAKPEPPVADTKPVETLSRMPGADSAAGVETPKPVVEAPAQEYKFETAQRWQPSQEETGVEPVPEYQVESIDSSAERTAYDVQEIQVEAEAQA